jgi:NAD(P)-dependent dehydrogenase (short-subunit alcohol dehydrogenase family)
MSDERKIAIVTGGAQGIGKGVTARLQAGGYGVVIADSDAEAGRETLAELAPAGPLWFAETDVAAEDSVAGCIASAIRYGGRLDAVVNNAGIARAPRVPVEQLTLESWNRQLGVNLTGAFLMAKHAAPHLRQGRGAIVNVASTRALQSEANTEAYSASKGGLVALTHALAVSLGPDVRVNCVSPGWIDVSGWQKSARRSRCIERCRSRPASGRPRRHAGGRGGNGRVPPVGGRRLRHRPELRRGRGDDEEDDLRAVGAQLRAMAHASSTHAMIQAVPPKGVTAPSQRAPVNASA